MLFAVVMVAAAIAIGTFVGSDGTTTEPARRSDAGAVTALEPATHVSGLVKAGLQPRPFSEIPAIEAPTAEEIPDGFVRMPGGEVRPRFGS
jgi:hypothetical protein